MLVRVDMDAIFLAGDDHRPGIEERQLLPCRGQTIVV